MTKSLFAAALLGLTLCSSFASLLPAVALTPQPVPQTGPSSALKITEILIALTGMEPDNADGYQFIEIKNTSANSMELKDVWIVVVNGRDSEDGEVALVQRLGTGGSFDQSRVLAAGEVLVVRDTEGGSSHHISPNGGSVLQVNFGDLLPDTGSYFLVGGKSAGLLFGDLLDDGAGAADSENDILDFAETSGSDTEEWTATYDHIWLGRPSLVDPDETDIAWTNGTFFPNAGSFGSIVCGRSISFTPDGFTRLNATICSSPSGWIGGLVYLTEPMNGSSQIYFSSDAYTWAVLLAGTPTLTAGNTRISPGLADGSQVTVSGVGGVFSH